MDTPLLASRSLLFPGPQPPLTHLGATLLRHVVGSGVRYSLYQLGLALPEGSPVRLTRLRLYLDAGTITKVIGESPGGAEVAAALLEPGGTARRRLPAGLGAAAAFHRLRFRFRAERGRLRGPLGPGRSRRQPGDGSWAAFRGALSAALPTLNDAFLAEVVASLARRGERRRGREAGPVSSPAAASWQTGETRRAASLGAPDLFRPSWAKRAPTATATRDTVATHPLRGRFRERYREALDALRPLYLDLAARAVRSGLLAGADDAFFLPLDLASDLELETRPAWLDGAVAANRAEYENWLGAPSPPEVLASGWESNVISLGGGGGWELAPLNPLS